MVRKVVGIWWVIFLLALMFWDLDTAVGHLGRIATALEAIDGIKK